MKFDGTFFVLTLSFVLFMLTMKSVFFDPIARVRVQREARMAEERKNAGKFREERENLLSSYEQHVRDARKQAQQLILEVRRQAKLSAAENLGQARGKAQHELDQQMQALSAWREETYKKLSVERQALAGLIIKKIAGKIPATSTS